MRYLITGGAGFIGSNIVERLLKEGNFVRVLDNFSSGKRENLAFAQKKLFPQSLNTIEAEETVSAQKKLFPQSSDTIEAEETVSDFIGNFDLIESDIRDKSACDQACSGIDYVLHQAALRSVPKSMKYPESYNEVNIGGTLNMLQAAAKNKVKRFVFASSSSIYGDTSKFPEQELDYPLLISPYALSKLAGEYYCRIFSEHFGLETVALRYFNVFGPRQALDDEYAVVIPKFIHCILNDQQPPIFGTGKQSRDFTYIDNVVEANILAATKGLTKKLFPQSDQKKLFPQSSNTIEAKETVSERSSHEVFNVANGKDNTVLQLVELLNEIIGKNILPVFLPIRAGDVLRTCADITKIQEKLGYKSKVDFEQGLRKTVEYFRKAKMPSLTR